MASRDYYDDLGVDPKATQAEIRKCFNKKAMASHPDTTKLDKKQALDRFRFYSEAYEVLGNEKKRRNYDHGKFGTVPKSSKTRRTGRPNPVGKDGPLHDDIGMRAAQQGFAEGLYNKNPRRDVRRWYVGQDDNFSGHQGYYSRKEEASTRRVVPKRQGGGGVLGMIGALTAVGVCVWGYRAWHRMFSRRE
jgi:DnaJ-class molecular chaperone